MTVGTETDINIATFRQQVTVGTETDINIATLKAASDSWYRDRHQRNYLLGSK